MNAARRAPHLAPVRETLETRRLEDGTFVLQQLRRHEPGMPQILCFPFAGGGPLAFRAFAERLPAGWGVWAIDFPGHVRTRGEPLTTIDEMVAQCLRAVPMELLTESFFVGYSLGGYVAHALAAALERMGHLVPGIVFSASAPPQLRPQGDEALSALDDEARFQWLKSIGQTSDDPVQRELYETFKRCIHADLQALDSYWPTTRVSAPALALGGSDDPVCSPHDLYEWEAFADGVTIEIVPGGHFFLGTAPDAMADAIATFIEGLTRTVTGEIRAVSGVDDLLGGDEEGELLTA